MSLEQPEPSDADIGPGGQMSKADHAYSVIRRKIIDGAARPGDRIVIEKVAREIDVSVVPVREAVRRLEAEGYVTYTRNVGATVATIDVHRYGETVEALAILEAAATALAAPHMSKTDIRRARKLNSELRQIVETLDPIRFTDKNHDFHESIYQCCPNRHLRSMVTKEWELLGSTRRSAFSFVPERAISSVGEHNDLLELIARGAPPSEIEAFAREHRMRTVRRTLDRLSSGLPETSVETAGTATN
jgi:DNA-binding GntR family transcriptional regulator